MAFEKPSIRRFIAATCIAALPFAVVRILYGEILASQNFLVKALGGGAAGLSYSLLFWLSYWGLYEFKDSFKRDPKEFLLTWGFLIFATIFLMWGHNH
jgi:hypothetical protein